MFRFFEAAARHLNFTRAAEEMHVTHGAVSQRIKRLEEHLGTPLFRRSGRRMLLTDEGSRLLERVRAAINEIAVGLTSIKLYDDELVPVCSPAFLGGQLPRVPGDLLKVPLLHDERQPWSIWFEAVGLDYRDAGQGPRYSEGNLLLPAAIAGLGVALARASLVEADLASGRLVELFSRSAPTRYSYFIVYPPGSERFEKIQVFQRWLLAQVPPVERITRQRLSVTSA